MGSAPPRRHFISRSSLLVRVCARANVLVVKCARAFSFKCARASFRVRVCSCQCVHARLLVQDFSCECARASSLTIFPEESFAMLSGQKDRRIYGTHEKEDQTWWLVAFIQHKLCSK